MERNNLERVLCQKCRQPVRRAYIIDGICPGCRLDAHGEQQMRDLQEAFFPGRAEQRWVEALDTLTDGA